MIRFILLVTCAYLIGSIPFGLLIGHVFKGVDIRDFGSKNIGATNIFRVLGPWPGLATLLLDICKGLLPILVARAFLPGHHLLHICTGFATIAGHNWSIFLNFSGGKGVATAAGVFFGILPGPAFVSLIVFCLVLFGSQYVSLSSISAAVTLTLTTLIIKRSPVLVLFTLIITVLIIIRHKENIKRLKEGNENKFDILKWFSKIRIGR